MVRAGALVFAAAATVAVLVPSPLGGNVGRMEDVLALPLAVGLLWPPRPPAAPRWPRRLPARLPRLAPWARHLVLPAVAVPLILSQWGPAWGAMTTAASQTSTHRSYFDAAGVGSDPGGGGWPGRPGRGGAHRVPLGGGLRGARHAAGPGLGTPARRGRQSAVLRRAHRLDGCVLPDWLLDNGVRFVALPDAPLDFAGTAEARLVAAGVPGLDLVWQSAHWRLYQVDGQLGHRGRARPAW